MKTHFLYKIGPIGLLGYIFSTLGAVFIVLGFVLSQVFKAFPENMEGDPQLFLFIFAGIGLVFLVLGLNFVMVVLRLKKRREQARDEGICLDADPVGCVEDTMVTIGHSHPFRLECIWVDPDTKETHHFRSEMLPGDISAMVAGEKIPVYVMRDNYRQYYVDLSKYVY